MNYRYLKTLITSGIKALAGAAALKSDYDKNKAVKQNSEKEIPKNSENVYIKNQDNAEMPEIFTPHTDWDKWETIYRRFTDRPPVKHERIYVPDYLWEIEPAEIPKISLTEKEAEEYGYSFRKKSKRIRITNYHGSEKSIIIPEYIGGMLVNEIGANAFSKSCAKRVAFPDNIKKLGEAAFAESGVQFVIFGKGIREIPKMCFYSCKYLRIAAIPPRTEKLGEKAFYGCGSLKY
ncbi:MAG: leucine-rich repeat domain-containing protein, partial [Oscillospiraceae bacterium]|nr:leucine-rich repeat domain-containing protein [Oscillospiraceae bacterium]